VSQSILQAIHRLIVFGVMTEPATFAFWALFLAVASFSLVAIAAWVTALWPTDQERRARGLVARLRAALRGG
jgi:hypothetical protein